MNYYKKQLEQLVITEYAVTVKFNSNGTSTQHLSLNKESIPVIIKWIEDLEFETKRQYIAHLIDGNPADVKLLKQEYEQLTGKRYHKKK